MALSRASFIVSFPEFANTPEALVEAKLAEAAAQMHAATWGDLYNAGQGNLAAALLGNSQKGLNSRQAGEAGTTYRNEYNRLRSLTRPGPILLG